MAQLLAIHFLQRIHLVTVLLATRVDGGYVSEREASEGNEEKLMKYIDSLHVASYAVVLQIETNSL